MKWMMHRQTEKNTHVHFAACATVKSQQLSSYFPTGRELALVALESCEQGVPHATIWKFFCNAEAARLGDSLIPLVE